MTAASVAAASVIYEGDIDLANLTSAGVNDIHARQKAELDGLLCHGIGARDDRLGGDHRTHITRTTRGNATIVGQDAVERAVDGAGLGGRRRPCPND